MVLTKNGPVGLQTFTFLQIYHTNVCDAVVDDLPLPQNGFFVNSENPSASIIKLSSTKDSPFSPSEMCVTHSAVLFCGNAADWGIISLWCSTWSSASQCRSKPEVVPHPPVVPGLLLTSYSLLLFCWTHPPSQQPTLLSPDFKVSQVHFIFFLAAKMIHLHFFCLFFLFFSFFPPELNVSKSETAFLCLISPLVHHALSRLFSTSLSSCW